MKELIYRNVPLGLTVFGGTDWPFVAIAFAEVIAGKGSSDLEMQGEYLEMGLHCEKPRDFTLKVYGLELQLASLVWYDFGTSKLYFVITYQ